MVLDHIASQAAGPGRSSSTNVLSRRKLLQAGAAAGGGLLLSLSLPLLPKRPMPMVSRPMRSSVSQAMDGLF
jgi:hypothetical protein